MEAALDQLARQLRFALDRPKPMTREDVAAVAHELEWLAEERSPLQDR